MNFQMLESFNESTLKQMIIDLHAENKKLKDELKISNDRYEKYWQKSHHIPEIQIVTWMEQNCIEADNITDKEGMLRAPTDLNTLYDNYKEWCLEEEADGTWVSETDKKTFKTQLLHWQRESKYKLSFGYTKEDGKPNGYLRSPLFNLKLV